MPHRLVFARPATARQSQAKRRRSRPLTLEQLEDRCVPAGDVVLEWNAIALDALKNDSMLGASARQNNPGNASRALAMVQAAVFDAVNSIDGSYTPYLTQVQAPAGASITAAAAQAAHDTLLALFPEFQATLDVRLATDLAAVPSAARDAGVQVGKAICTAMLAARVNDGSAVSVVFTPGTQPGQWRPDPLHPQQRAWGPEWGAVAPFAIPNAAQFQAPAPPALDSQAYAAAYQEVKNYGGDGITTPTLRTAEQTQIAIFWGYDGSFGLATPPRLYNQIAETVAVQQHNTVVQNARFFALVNLAMADAGFAAWDSKYVYDFWRPVTAIRENDPNSPSSPTGLGSGNPYLVGQGDPHWTPLGAPADNVPHATNFTPPFPAYTSGHATFGGALFQTMADFYGADNIHFTIGSDEFNGVTRDQNGLVRPVVTRSFDSFSQAAEENGQSRIYLGIHWSFDKVQGISEGKAVANYIFGHLLQSRDLTVTHAGTTAVHQHGSNLEVVDAGGNVLTSAPLSQVRSLTVAGGAGANTLILDFHFGGAFTLPGGITFNGQGLQNEVDFLGTDNPDTINVTGNTMQVDSLAVTLNNVQSLNLDGAGGANTFHLSGSVPSNVTLSGGTGNDVYQLATTNARLTIKDSGGTDTLDFSAASLGLLLDLSQSAGQWQFANAGGNLLRLFGTFENVIGTSFNDMIEANSANDQLFGGPGNDTLIGGSGTDLLSGGPGNNLLIGGTGNAIFVGGGGNDQILAYFGSNVLIGGGGADLLFSGTNSNLLITGSTLYDNNPAALEAILAEWTSQAALATRIHHLKNGGGLNGTNVLVPGQTVFDSPDRSMLLGFAAESWMMAGKKDLVYLLGLQMH